MVVPIWRTGAKKRCSETVGSISWRLSITREDAGKVVFRGQYTAVPDLAALDISVLGRNVTRLFAVSVAWLHDVVCLPGQRHHYTIEQD